MHNGILAGFSFAVLFGGGIGLFLWLKARRRRKLRDIGSKLGLSLVIHSYGDHLVGAIEGRQIRLESHSQGRNTWAIAVATPAAAIANLSALKRDWNRSLTDGIAHGSELRVKNAQLSKSMLLRSRTPEHAAALLTPAVEEALVHASQHFSTIKTAQPELYGFGQPFLLGMREGPGADSQHLAAALATMTNLCRALEGRRGEP